MLPSASAALDSGQFAIKAVNTGDTKIVGSAGVKLPNDEGETPEVPETPTYAADEFVFTINTAISGCTNPNLFVEPLAGAKLISPSGAEKIVVGDYADNKVAESGKWILKGGFTNLQLAGAGSVDCYTSIDHWGSSTGTTSLQHSFSSATANLTYIASPPATVTQMNQAFTNAKGFNGDISGWNTSNVTNMRMMFYDANSFNRPLNNWDVSKVTNMEGMFNTATAFNQNLNSWDTSKVTTMSTMFTSASSFRGNISDWNVENVQDMFYMFYASNFTGDLSNWKACKIPASGPENFSVSGAKAPKWAVCS